MECPFAPLDLRKAFPLILKFPIRISCHSVPATDAFAPVDVLLITPHKLMNEHAL